MTRPELTKVVQIGSGEVIYAAIEDLGHNRRIWRLGSLKKDGGIPMNRIPDGHMIGQGARGVQDWAIYNPEVEALAQSIRAHIAELRVLIEREEHNLLTLYLPK